MLQRVSMENFRCFRSLHAPLRPLTVLVGPNDTGKSAFLAAIQYLLSRREFRPTDYLRGERNLPITISGETSSGTGYLFSARGPEGFEAFVDTLPVGFFHLTSRGVPMESAGTPSEGAAPDMDYDGSNVPALLDYLLRRDRKRFFDVVAAVKRLTPGLEDVNIGTPNQALRRVDLAIEGGFQLPADLASSGVRMLLFFVCLAYHPRSPKVVLLEEPETAIHPKRLGHVMGLLRELVSGAHGGHPVQLIVTTHSPYLLDHVRMGEDQVLVFHRDNDGSRTAEPADAERLKLFLDEFLLGEVWYNQGEEGLVKKHK
ncbi:MAG TPA: AAA family ATPase [Gemmataceae bacterium]|nr:AAA family ATPase [Gemmataceae bacterium]